MRELRAAVEPKRRGKWCDRKDLEEGRQPQMMATVSSIEAMRRRMAESSGWWGC